MSNELTGSSSHQPQTQTKALAAATAPPLTVILAWFLNYIGAIQLEVDASLFVIALSTIVSSGISYIVVYFAPRNKPTSTDGGGI